MPESVVAYRWRAEVFEPAIAAVPAELRGKREAAELFHEILEHRWYLSEEAGRDVGIDRAVKSYVDQVLRHAADERTLLRLGSRMAPAAPEEDEGYVSERRARLVGVNHVALEVGDIDEALAWYGRFFELRLRGRAPGMAFIDIGDQFLALAEGARQRRDDGRHFGLVVDDKEAVAPGARGGGRESFPARSRLPRPVGQPRRGGRLPRHPVHEGAARSLRGMGVDDLEKTERALAELREKGLDSEG